MSGYRVRCPRSSCWRPAASRCWLSSGPEPLAWEGLEEWQRAWGEDVETFLAGCDECDELAQHAAPERLTTQ